MKAHQATYPVRVMGRLLGVSASGFYASLKRPPSRRALQDIALTARIHAIHRRSGGAYGAPSLHAELADDHGIRIGRKRVARLMRAAGLKGLSPPTFIATTVTDPDADRALDKVGRRFSAEVLRTVIRIADSAGGLARAGRDERFVDLPLGLVALFWVRSFQPLIAKNLPQHPAGNARLAFVKEGFRRLQARSAHDLRIGQRFTGDAARDLILALRDAAKCIRHMPATFTTYPGSSDPIFPCARRPVRIRDSVRVDEAFLWSFGTFSVPVNLWQAMSRYAAWIEPAVLNEWIEMMRGYARQPDSQDAHMAALRWLEPGHDTGLVRGLGRRLRDSGTRLYCVWTRNRLKSDFDIDHCFPFAAWPCNDLWNLLPSAPAVNRSKGDRLPAAEALERSRSWILEWWDLAYRRDIVLRTQFEDEAQSALPSAVFGLEETVTPEDVFEGLMVQQMVLKRDQQRTNCRSSIAGTVPMGTAGLRSSFVA